MDCQEARMHLRKAKTAHLKWRTYAQAIAAGVPVDESNAPLDHTHCAFGRWYHGEGQQLKGISQRYADIEAPHRLLHEAYAGIYQLVQARKLAQATEKLRELEQISRSLIEVIDECMADLADSR